MAPEIFKPPYNNQVDMFSLGIVLLEKEFEIIANDMIYVNECEERLEWHVKERTIKRQYEVNDLLIEMLVNCNIQNSENVKRYQNRISNNHKQAYQMRKIHRNKFTDDDFIFMLVAMLQVIYINIFLKILAYFSSTSR